MKKHITMAFVGFGAFLLLATFVLPVYSPVVSAQSSLKDDVKCQPNNPDCVPDITDPATTQDCKTTDCNVVNKYLNPFIRFLTIVVGIAVAMGIIIGGIQYSSSAGDPQKVAKAKGHIRNAVIALIAYFFLYAFIQFLVPGGNLAAPAPPPAAPTPRPGGPL